jgi:hypothetical protein
MPAGQTDRAARAAAEERPQKNDCQNAEGVGEMAEVRTQAAE